MKKQLITLGLLLNLSTFALAGPSHKSHSENRYNVVEELNLSQEQQVKYEEVMKSKKESMEAAMLVIQEETKAQLSTILSAEQMQILEQKKMKRTKRMKRKRMHRNN